MMREFCYFVRTHIPGTPPFVILVFIFMAFCLALYGITRSRGYLVTFWTGFLYLVPWAITCVIH